MMFITLFKKVTELFEKKLYIFYLLFLVFTICISITYTFFYIDKFQYQFNENNEIILKEIPFGYGQIIDNLYHYNKFEQIWFGINTYLTRLPFLPLFISSLSKISLNAYFVVTIKNIIFFSLIFYCTYVVSKNYNNRFPSFLILLGLFFYNFYNTTVLSTIVFADAYIAAIIPCIFLILISNDKKKYILISALIFILYFTKTTVFYLAISIPILFLVLENNLKFYKKLLPIFSVSVAIILWGTFGQIKTGKFPIGSTMLSNNQEALSIALNKDFKKYYPKLSVDLIPFENVDKKYDNEWEFSEYYKKKNKDYFVNNKLNIFKDVLIKLNFIFFNFRKDAVSADLYSDYKNPVVFSHIFNRLIFIISIILLVNNLFKDLKQKKFQKINIYYSTIIIFSLLPHIIGWATSKHLVPLFLVSNIYFFLNFKYFKKITQ